MESTEEDLEERYQQLLKLIREEEQQRKYADRVDDYMKYLTFFRDRLRLFLYEMKVHFDECSFQQYKYVMKCFVEKNTLGLSEDELVLTRGQIDSMRQIYQNMLDYIEKCSNIEDEIIIAANIAQLHRIQITKGWNEQIAQDENAAQYSESLERKYRHKEEAFDYISKTIGINTAKFSSTEEILSWFNLAYEGLSTVKKEISEESIEWKKQLLFFIHHWEKSIESGGVSEETPMFRRTIGEMYRNKAMEEVGKFKLIAYLGDKLDARFKLQLEFYSPGEDLYFSHLVSKFKLTGRI